MLHAAADRLVPSSQAASLRHAVVTYLQAASDVAADPARGLEGQNAARREAEALPEPARTLMQAVNARDVGTLGSQLLPFVEQVGGAPELSPDRSPVTTAPVFLIHGSEDSVIPSEETARAAADLQARGNPHVRWLLTPLLTHADLREGASIGDTWRLVSFWTAMSAAAR